MLNVAPNIATKGYMTELQKVGVSRKSLMALGLSESQAEFASGASAPAFYAQINETKILLFPFDERAVLFDGKKKAAGEYRGASIFLDAEDGGGVLELPSFMHMNTEKASNVEEGPEDDDGDDDLDEDVDDGEEDDDEGDDFEEDTIEEDVKTLRARAKKSAGKAA